MVAFEIDLLHPDNVGVHQWFFSRTGNPVVVL